MSFNAILLTKLIKLFRTKLTTIMSPQHLNLATSLIFQKRFKLLKPTKDLRFTSKKIYPCPCALIIDELHILETL